MEESKTICLRRGGSITHACRSRVKSRGSQLVFPAPPAAPGYKSAPFTGGSGLKGKNCNAQVPRSVKVGGEGKWSMNIKIGPCQV